VDGFEQPWIEGENFYDYVRARHVALAVKNFPQLLRRAYA
jgi:hypothetical protein